MGGGMIDQSLLALYTGLSWQPFTWFGLFVFLTALDGVLTTYALKNGAMEANKVMAFIMSKIGVIPALGLTKLMGIAAIYGSLQSFILYVPLLVAFFGLVCVWNLWVILRGKK
jgi:Domain of unknown function (DUF5658)